VDCGTWSQFGKRRVAEGNSDNCDANAEAKGKERQERDRKCGDEYLLQNEEGLFIHSNLNFM
jgi:hypothetical protein